ncbi:MAG: S-layer homology domain-containing protein [Clostridia bacterium]|nr:S-layer homology domain-containing protein [Clostridia bacterium]
MKNILKKSFAIIALVAVIFTNIPVYVFAASVDTTIPTVTISGIAANTTVKKGASLSFKVYFDDETALASTYLTSSHVSTNGFDASVSVSGTGTVRTVTLNNIQGSGEGKTVTIAAGVATDEAGNKSKAATSRSFTIDPGDVTIPTVNINKPSPSTVQVGGTVTYTVYFDDETAVKAVNFSANDVTLNGFSATKSVSGSGNDKRTVTLSNIQGTADADNYITVSAGVVVDTSGNKSKAVNSSKFAIQAKPVVDSTIPTVTISKPTPSSIYAGETVKYTVYFDDETKMGTVNFNKDYVDLHGFTANITVTSSSDYTKVVTLSNIQGAADADNYITVLSGAAQDATGNKTKAANSSEFTIKAKIVKPEPEPVVKDTIAPVVKIGAANPKSIYSGGTVKYTVTFSDNVKVTDVNLTASKIDLVGFTADVSVKVDGVKSATITLKNVKGNAGVNKYIKIDAGVALDEPGNRSAQAISPKFSIVKKTSTIVGTTPTVTKYTTNCIDDLSLLGDINKEITYFASWLRAEKYTATYVQENNYVAEDETMTYMVEYYNGSTAPAPDVTFDLTIPYKVVVEEINGNGKITKQTDNETVITWNVGTVPSYAASQGRGYCRLYVRVRFLENETLEKSDKISETFYATLKTTADGNHSYSYMRQLFIDTTEGKTGTYKSYLTTVDTTNQVRPDDEITRAEFAKLLADSGILDVKVGSNDYKTFKDHESIPAYARDAVSALVKTDIIQAFPDGEFKPNNPILMEDAMQMIAQAATYISEQKLTVYKPVFLYTEALTGSDKKVSEKKDYIMELMRQNVVVKYESNPDTYALRKHVVAMVNSLTFRGPYVETLPENTLKFADIRDDSVFFYNIVGASNSYKYTYDYRLWQQIVEIVK